MERPNFSEPSQEDTNDHRRLLDRLAVVEAETQPDRIQTEIRALVPLLEMHFEREERLGGMFEKVRAKDPRLTGEIDSLRDDHVALVEGALALVEAASEAARFRLQAHDFLSDVHNFITHLRRHEAREDALLTDAHYHEEGGGD
jgi:hypothetical protein